MFNGLIFFPIHSDDSPWPKPWRCWLHRRQPSRCHPSGCPLSLWAPVLRWLLAPSLFVNQDHSICWASTLHELISGLNITIFLKVTDRAWRPPPECLQLPSGKHCHSGPSPLELEQSRKTRNDSYVHLREASTLLRFKEQVSTCHSDAHHPWKCHSLNSLAQPPQVPFRIKSEHWHKNIDKVFFTSCPQRSEHYSDTFAMTVLLQTRLKHFSQWEWEWFLSYLTTISSYLLA